MHIGRVLGCAAPSLFAFALSSALLVAPSEIAFAVEGGVSADPVAASNASNDAAVADAETFAYIADAASALDVEPLAPAVEVDIAFGAADADADVAADAASDASANADPGAGASIPADSQEALNGWVTDAAGVRHWYDDGVMAADKAFCDLATDEWYWADADGSIAVDKDAWIPESNDNRLVGKWVRLDSDGCMVKGEDYRYGGWYYFDQTTGEMAKGFRFIDSDGGKWVYYDQVTGQMLYGEQAIDGNWYYFDPCTGAVDYGWAWLPEPDKWVYYDTTTGIMVHGWQCIDGEWCWFDTYTGQSDVAQYYRWMMRTASGEVGINFFNDSSCSQEAYDALLAASNEFWGNGHALGYVMMDLSTGKGICSNIDYTFYGASTVKAPYIMSVMSNVWGFDANAVGEYYDKIHGTLTWSDNVRYLSLREDFGSDIFCDWLGAAGVDESIGEGNWVYYSPRELGKIWLQMYSDMGKGSGGSLIGWLTGQSEHSAIRMAIDGRCSVCSKPGWTECATNDAGIVYSEAGGYLLVVMSDAPDWLDALSHVAAALDAVHASMLEQ